MPININNAYSLIGNRNIGLATGRIGENLSKLASGFAINKAADNAAGLAISEQLQADIKSMEQAQRNINDGAALTRVAEGGLNEISDLLARGRELSIQAATGTLSDEQRNTLNKEITSIKDEINRITNVTEFNGQKVLGGQLAPGAQTQVNVQAGIQNTEADKINLNVVDATDTSTLGIQNVDIGTQKGATDALAAFDTAIQRVTQTRANIGAIQNRLTAAAGNLSVSRENLIAANTAIRGLDYAKESGDFAKNSILAQAATNILKQGQQSQAGIVGSLLNIKV